MLSLVSSCSVHISMKHRFSIKCSQKLRLGVTSTFLIACLSPIESEMETSTDILHFCALARGATYSKEDPGSSWRSISTTSLGDQSTFSSEAGESSGTRSARLPRTRYEAHDISMHNTSKGPTSASTKYKSQRSKLSRASTVCIRMRIERHNYVQKKVVLTTPSCRLPHFH